MSLGLDPLSPSEWLSDKAIQAADLETRGAWHETRCHMRHNGTGELTRTLSSWARIWGCNPDTATALIGKLDGIAVVKANGVFITLRCPKMYKRVRAMQQNQLRVQKHRGTLEDDHPFPANAREYDESSMMQELTMLVARFKRLAKWTGDRIAFEQIKGLIEHYPESDIGAIIERYAKPGMKPWELSKILATQTGSDPERMKRLFGKKK